ncbi:FAD-dependent oxidoreductase [Flindersiella endophytica]
MGVATTDIAILGAGPYGLAVAAHLRRAGVDHRVIGDPMSFWRAMPEGMLLRSNWTASCIADYQGELNLDSFIKESGVPFERPVPLERFIAYGEWVQSKVAPDVDRRTVRLLEKKADDGFLLHMSDGDPVSARRVVVAAGIAPFARRPNVFANTPRRLATHAGDHRSFSEYAGKSVLVVGGGQSALESAALLREAGAGVEVVVRRPNLIWLHGGKYHRMLGKYSKLVYAPTDVGPMGLSRLVAVPELFRRLPRGVQTPLAYRAIRPAGAAWLVDRLADIPIRLGRQVRAAKPVNGHVRIDLDDGESRLVDHVVYGTGYQVDITRYPFFSPDLLQQVEQLNGYPILRRGLETSVPGLHIVGAPAAWSFGPIMRFVSGGWYAAGSIVRSVTRKKES